MEKPMPDTKVCSKCGIVKDKRDFHKSRKSKDGCQCWCKACLLDYQIKYFQTEKGKKALKRAQEKYLKSEKRKKAQERYLKSEKGKKAQERYFKSMKFKKTREEYLKRVKVQEMREDRSGEYVEKVIP